MRMHTRNSGAQTNTIFLTQLQQPHKRYSGAETHTNNYHTQLEQWQQKQ